MRKILSIILTAAMTLSLFAAIPFGASAEAVGTPLTFDAKAEIDYYNTVFGKNSTADVQDSGTPQGYAFKYTVLDNDWGEARESILRIAQPQPDGSVSSYKVKAGRTYSISFKYKNDTPVSSWGFYTKILFVSELNNMGNLFDDFNGCVRDWSAKIHIPDITISPGTNIQDATVGWQDYSASFYVPKNITLDEIALIFAIDDTNTEASFWVDDILVQEADDNGVSVMDFQSEAAKTFYADGYNNQQFEISQTWRTSDDLGMKFSSVAGCATDNTTTTPVFRLSQSNANGTVTPITVKAGESYELSIDYKNDWGVNTWGNFYVKLMYIDGTQRVQGLTGSQVNNWKDWDKAYRVNLEGENTFPNKEGTEWQTYTFSFTVPDVADEKQLAIGMVNSEDVTGQGFFDNVTLKRKADVILHNDSLENGSYTASVLEGTAIEKIHLPVAGSKITRLYTDAARTQLYAGATVNESLELWADIESVTSDFDNCILAKDGFDGPDFVIVENVGVNNSSALTNKNSSNNLGNSEWPPVIKLINADGSNFTTVSGHTYKLNFKMQLEDKVNYNKTGCVAVVKNPFAPEGKVQTYSEYTQTNLETAFAGVDKYKEFEYTFDGTGDSVYIAAWCADTQVYYDDIKIVDITAQKALSDQNGNVLARGYDGETVKILDAADADFVYYADENGTPVDTTVIRDNKTLTKVNSTIAVTDTDYDSVNRTVSFTTRFGGIGYTNGTNKVTVNTITVDNKCYYVEDIGLLVAPTANVSGELTLDNLCGATKISGTSLKYSANGTDELTIIAQIKTSIYDRNYTVVGYVKCAGGKVIYSKTRNSIAKSYNAAAGIESVGNDVYTKNVSGTTYNLVNNSEFNNGLNGKWIVKDTVQNIKSYNATLYSKQDAVSVKDGKLVIASTADRANNCTYSAQLLSNYKFTNGYIEVKAKFSSTKATAGSIWLNMWGITENDLFIKPDNSENRYVYPEIDIIEFDRDNQHTYSTIHSWGNNENGDFVGKAQRLLDNNNNAEHDLDLSKEHTYGFERTNDTMRIWIDGYLTYEINKADCLYAGDYTRTENEMRALFENPACMVIENWLHDPNSESGTAEIDYVRFYQ